MAVMNEDTYQVGRLLVIHWTMVLLLQVHEQSDSTPPETPESA